VDFVSVRPVEHRRLAERILRQVRGSFSRRAADSHHPEAEMDRYARKADHIVVKHARGQVIALIEIVSPGNKGSWHALRTFVEKMAALMDQGIHLLVIDLFPPSVRDPQGIHMAIWQEVTDEPFELPPDKNLTTVAYSAGGVKTAYVEPIAVGDILPDMPLFLDPGLHVPVALEATYQATWNVFPEELRELLVPSPA